MKTKSIQLFALLVLGMVCNAQNANEILKASYSKCKEVKSGSYELIYKWKPMTDKDTFPQYITTEFEKIKNDSLFPMKFMNKFAKYNSANVYTGNELIYLNGKDSTATITANSIHAEYIQSIKHNYVFFESITKTDHFFEERVFSDSANVFTYLGKEIVGNKSCYKIQIRKPDDKPVKNDFYKINDIGVLWINEKTYIPMRFDRNVDVINSKDTMHQYHSSELKRLTVDTVFDAKYFSQGCIPKYYIQKDFVPYKEPELLKQGTEAPAWNLTSMNDKKYELKDFRGKLVMLDFFYKGCGPCMLALPALEKLHEKYKDKGFALIGIDTYDKKGDGIEEFLTKRGVTYPILLGGHDVSKEYYVYAAPTMYFIDKDGKIITTQVGYGEKLDDELEKIILAHLP